MTFDYDLFVIGGGLPFACVGTQEGEVVSAGAGGEAAKRKLKPEGFVQ